jgi:hypothetical protein
MFAKSLALYQGMALAMPKELPRRELGFSPCDGETCAQL